MLERIGEPEPDPDQQTSDLAGLVDVVGTNWNQIKRELVTMWQIVRWVREETTAVA